MKEIVIGPNDGGQRLDKFLLKSLPALPPALMHKYIRLKRIKRNGKRAQAGDKLETGDVIPLPQRRTAGAACGGSGFPPPPAQPAGRL